MLRQKSRRYDGYGSYAPLKNATNLLQLLLQILLLHISLNYYVITLLRHYVSITFYRYFLRSKIQSGTGTGTVPIFVFTILHFNRSFT